MRQIRLDDWKLCGYYPYVPILGKSMETGGWFLPATQEISAKVPGSVYTDLFRAGIIQDPYFELNSLNCEWVSQRWWKYRCSFEIEDVDNELELIFEGVDYKAKIYLNNEEIGKTQNMFTAFAFRLNGRVKKGSNLLEVVLCGVPDEMGQIGLTSRAKSLKSRFTYKWDFSVRLINMGIYKPVYINIYDSIKTEEIYFKTICASEGKAKLIVHLASRKRQECEYTVNITDEKGNQAFNAARLLKLKKGSNRIDTGIHIQNAMLWYPNNMGDQPLYKLSVRIKTKDGETFSEQITVGFKEFELEKSPGAPRGLMGYAARINGLKVYIKGVNFVPMDNFYGSIPDEKYIDFFKMIAAANINLIRVWGGGLIESELFYSLADRYGIMVWQEFPQSSSGIENVPCKDKVFLKGLKQAAKQAVTVKRNNVSMCIWCGGNELTDLKRKPADIKDKNLKMLRNVVRKHHRSAVFLPTSSSGPESFRSDNGIEYNHDVHGPWQYLGSEEHYSFYNNTKCLLHSEFGVDGMAGTDSLKRFLSEDNLSVFDNKNLVWRHHGEWWITTDRDMSIFGKIDDIEELVDLSQYIQAEGLRYALEANRREALNSGSIIWQANEPYPNVACTSLIDYYNKKKPALKAAEKAFSPLNVSLKYPKLVYSPGEEININAYVIWDGGLLPTDTEIVVKAGDEVRNERHSLMAGEAEAKELFFNIFNGLIAPQKGPVEITLHAKNPQAEFSNTIILLVKEGNYPSKQAVRNFMSKMEGKQ